MEEKSQRKVVVVEEEMPPLPKMEEKPELPAGEAGTPPESSWKAQLAEKPAKKLPPLALYFVVFSLGLIFGIAISFLAFSSGTVSLGPTPTPYAVVTTSPEATPTPVADRSLLRISVLNGTGIKGEGARAKEYLEGLGYKVAEVANAANSNYKLTEISISQEKDEYLDLLKADLAEKYPISEKKKVLKDTSSSDAQIIIGKE